MTRMELKEKLKEINELLQKCKNELSAYKDRDISFYLQYKIGSTISKIDQTREIINEMLLCIKTNSHRLKK